MDIALLPIIIILAVTGTVVYLARRGREYDRERGVVAPKARPASGNAKGGGSSTLGQLLLIGGIVGALIVLQIDTSVSTGAGSRVHNIGLMNQQQNYLIFFALLAIVGAILMATTRR